MFAWIQRRSDRTPDWMVQGECGDEGMCWMREDKEGIMWLEIVVLILVSGGVVINDGIY